MFDRLSSVFNKCLAVNKDGAKSVAYIKNELPATKQEKVVVESLPAADVLATKDSVNSTISPETEATAEYINEKPFRPNEKRARVLRIKMSETESEGMYEIEVEDQHNNRFYELHNKDVEFLAKILVSLPRTRSLEVIATPLLNNGETKSGSKKRNPTLNTTHFRRLIQLSRLCIRLNGLLELSISAPFYFPIQELCLSNVDIKLYDFAMLIRCVGHTLKNLCLEQMRIIESVSSNDFLLQLQRIRSLQSLRIDLSLSEIHPSLSESVVNKFSTLFVSSASLDFFFDAPSFDVAKTVFTQKLFYKHNYYGLEDIKSLELAVEDRRRRNKSVRKLRVVIGLPTCWSTKVENCHCESVLKIGNLEICQLTRDDSSSIVEEMENQDRTLFKLRI